MYEFRRRQLVNTKTYFGVLFWYGIVMGTLF